MVEADLRAYRRLPDAAKTKEFEAAYFNRAVQFLDYMFVHGLRALEGKEGNPLIEVRVLCNLILLNDGKLQVETPQNGRCLPEDRSSSRRRRPF